MPTMKTPRIAAVVLCGLVTLLSKPTVFAQGEKLPAIALVGGTLIDVSHGGHSGHDIPDGVVILRGGKIEAAGAAAQVKIPADAKKIDCTGAYILPGLVDGFAGLNSQAQANATLYMGVTTIVGSQDDRRGMLKRNAAPSPHIYLLDSVGYIDQYSLLFDLPQWKSRLKDGAEFVDLDEQGTKSQLEELAGRGVRVAWLGHELTAARTKFIITEAHRLGLIAYGEFISTPYAEGLKDGVDVLLHMSRYELGLVPARLQEPLVRDPEGAALGPVYEYLRRLQPDDASIKAYANQITAAGPALMPTLSLSYLQLPNHRNLWKEPAATILDPKAMYQPADPVTGEDPYRLDDSRRLEAADYEHFWVLNQAIQIAHPINLAGSGASAFGTMPGISMHTELELLVRLGLTPREALAAATSNYSEKFGWNELGLVEAGRRADLLILDADPVKDISNTRKIRSVILEGVVLDRTALLSVPASGK